MKERKGILWILITFEFVALVVIVACGMVLGNRSFLQSGVRSYLESVPSTDEIDVAQVEIKDEATPMSATMEGEFELEEEEVFERPTDFSDSVKLYLDSMTTEQKVAQLLIVKPNLLANDEVVTGANYSLKKALEKNAVGGFLFTSDNYVDDNQFTKLIKDINVAASAKTNLNTWIFALDKKGELVVQKKYSEDSMCPLFYEDAQETVTDDKLYKVKEFVANLDAYSDWDSCVKVRNTNEAQKLSDLGFNGVIISVNSNPTASFISSGCDMLYVDSNYETVYGNILDGVLNGTISIERLNDAVSRVLQAKEKLIDMDM